jgi:hypothetical protein
MLRVGFLPSDFNPMVLVLGEAEDLRLLAGTLRRFARDREDVHLHELGFCEACTSVTVTASPGAPGIQPIADNSFVWRLGAEQAGAFADQIDELAVPSRAAGSEILECTTEEEIPVKVSRGEYTDDFLR